MNTAAMYTSRITSTGQPDGVFFLNAEYVLEATTKVGDTKKAPDGESMQTRWWGSAGAACKLLLLTDPVMLPLV